MAWAGDPPWHKMGKHVSHDLTPAQMMKEAGLDWKVEKIPSFIWLDDDQVSINKSALIRSSDNSILDVVPDSWQPLQNETAFEFFKDFVMQGDMEMHTAGSLKNGKLVWALAKVKDGFFVGKNKDEVQSHLLFTNPHQFGKAIDVRFTPIRVVCWNTLSLAISSSKQQQVVKASHRNPFDANRVKNTLGVAHKLLMEYEEAANYVASKNFTSDTLNEYFKDIFPDSGKNKKPSKNYEIAKNILDTQPGADLNSGTWWHAFNTITYMVDHIIGRSPETRLDSAWFGSNRVLKSTALNKAVVMAENA